MHKLHIAFKTPSVRPSSQNRVHRAEQSHRKKTGIEIIEEQYEKRGYASKISILPNDPPSHARTHKARRGGKVKRRERNDVRGKQSTAPKSHPHPPDKAYRNPTALNRAHVPRPRYHGKRKAQSRKQKNKKKDIKQLWRQASCPLFIIPYSLPICHFSMPHTIPHD